MTWRRTCAARSSLSSPDVCAPSISPALGHLSLSLSEELLMGNLAHLQQLLALPCKSRTWSRIRWSGRPVVAVMLLFSIYSRLRCLGRTRHCSQICNSEFLRDQQRSTIQKMQPAESTGDKVYTKKVTHLIPNQIPSLGETC